MSISLWIFWLEEVQSNHGSLTSPSILIADWCWAIIWLAFTIPICFLSNVKWLWCSRGYLSTAAPGSCKQNIAAAKADFNQVCWAPGCKNGYSLLYLLLTHVYQAEVKTSVSETDSNNLQIKRRRIRSILAVCEVAGSSLLALLCMHAPT